LLIKVYDRLNIRLWQVFDKPCLACFTLNDLQALAEYALSNYMVRVKWLMSFT